MLWENNRCSKVLLASTQVPRCDHRPCSKQHWLDSDCLIAYRGLITGLHCEHYFACHSSFGWHDKDAYGIDGTYCVTSLQFMWATLGNWIIWRTHDATVYLTHFPLNKMAAILADDSFKCILVNENNGIPIWISLKFVPRSLIDNKPAWV